MKKKLNLLWNLKFNFFSVAERPLTFFAYFLNAKKVGRRRLVIGPAKAGAFLFSHTRLPFPPRPLLPFGRISPAAKPGWPVIGPTFWVCRAKSGAAFRCAKPPCAVVRFAAMTSSPRTDVLACPAFALLSHSPTALLNTPALVAVRLHFACAKPRWPVVAPAGGNVLATPFSLCSNVAPRSHPGAQLRFILKQLYASGCPFLRNFPFFSSVPHPFFASAPGRTDTQKSAAGIPRRGFNTFSVSWLYFPLPNT